MHVATHGLLSWLLSTRANLDRRDRVLVTLAGLAPDIDGLGLIVDLLTGRSAHPTSLWSQWHHVAGHNLVAALVTTAIVAGFARRRLACALLALVAFHLHLLCDLVGSGGPGGERWTTPYFWPFTTAALDWPGQWAVNGWQNLATTTGALFLCLRFSWRHGISPLEILSPRLDGAVAAALRGRFGQPRP